MTRVPNVHHYRFGTFVEGPANAEAVAAARAAACPAADAGGVLVVSGAVGLGKTHLLHAIVNEAHRQRVRAAYLTIENLIHRVLRGLGRDHADDLDDRLGRFAVLAVDDVDGLAGRQQLSAAIGQLLARLEGRCRQLVLAAVDGPRTALARWLPGPARLVELASPDPATRLRILATQARRAGIALPLDVAQRVAMLCTGSVRELEGALVRLGAYAMIARRPITVDLVDDVLRPILPRPAAQPRQPRPRPRLRAVARTAAAPEELLAGIGELLQFAREVGGGRIGDPDVQGPDVYVRLVARDGEPYVLRMRVGAYLAAPLRCAFVTEQHRRSAAAWPYPDERGPFRSPDFICTPPVAEFYAYHPERTYRRGDGSFTATVAAVFAALHAPEYGGRFTVARQRGAEGW